MNREDILELIQTVVRPLRERIDHLEKQNEKLRLQITTQNHQPQRLRSISRQQHRIPKKEEYAQAARSPSIKKKDDKPLWNPTGRVKPQAPTYKCKDQVNSAPPPVDKHKAKPVSPKVATRAQSKETHQKTPLQKSQSSKKKVVQNLSSEKPEVQYKKIKGGQKFSEENSNTESHLKTESVKDKSKPTPKHNPQNTSSQQHSSHRSSQLLHQEVQNS